MTEFTTNMNKEAAVFFMRALLGVLFLFQGYDKIFVVKTDGVMNTFYDFFAHKKIPSWLMRVVITLSSYIEFIGGVLLLIGFQRELTLYFLGLDLLFAAFAFSLIKPMWDMQFYFPRFLLLILLLLLPKEWDRFSIDALLS